MKDHKLPPNLIKLLAESTVRTHLEESSKQCRIIYQWKARDLMEIAYLEGIKDGKKKEDKT